MEDDLSTFHHEDDPLDRVRCPASRRLASRHSISPKSRSRLKWWCVAPEEGNTCLLSPGGFTTATLFLRGSP